MEAQKYARKAASVILFALSLVVLLGGYLASFSQENNLFIAAGVVFSIALVLASSALWE